MTAANDELTSSTVSAVNRFNAAVNQQDVDAVMAAMTDDCIFENTSPSPDGTRYEGYQPVKEFWEKFFHNSPTARFATEEMIAFEDRCIVRWVYHKTKEGVPWHLRGIDLFRVENGKIAEKLSYVKG